jgi:hypothetical protein
MSRKLSFTILEGMRDHDSYFKCKPDVGGKLGFSAYQKCYAAIRILAGDLVDEYLRMSETTCLELMYKFCKVVIVVFDNFYLR